jgi:hypothetical protein
VKFGGVPTNDRYGALPTNHVDGRSPENEDQQGDERLCHQGLRERRLQKCPGPWAGTD